MFDFGADWNFKMAARCPILNILFCPITLEVFVQLIWNYAGLYIHMGRRLRSVVWSWSDIHLWFWFLLYISRSISAIDLIFDGYIGTYETPVKFNFWADWKIKYGHQVASFHAFCKNHLRYLVSLPVGDMYCFSNTIRQFLMPGPWTLVRDQTSNKH